MRNCLTVIILQLLFSLNVAGQETDIYRLPAGASRVSSPENLNGVKGQGGMTNKRGKGHAFISIKAGETASLLETTGPGQIGRVWLTVNDRSPEMLRGLRLKMYWDGAKTPAVDVPLGDFFCDALGQNAAFENALFSSAEGRSFNCYIPMPFKTGARILLANESGKDLSMLFFDVDFVKNPQSEDMLYFHACWNRQQNPVGQDVTLLPQIKGKGRFIGVSAGVNVNPAYGHTWWGEGEVKMYLDGDTQSPTINGTGSEDYIGSGWFEGVFVNRYQGCLLADRQGGHYAFYRFHIPDAIYFNHDFKATLQQLGGWYAKDVKALQANGVPLLPVSLYGAKGFRGLLDKSTSPDELANSDDQDWECFYRSDDYAVTAYYYLDRP